METAEEPLPLPLRARRRAVSMATVHTRGKVCAAGRKEAAPPRGGAGLPSHARAQHTDGEERGKERTRGGQKERAGKKRGTASRRGEGCKAEERVGGRQKVVARLRRRVDVGGGERGGGEEG